jgi:hypothetical protein
MRELDFFRSCLDLTFGVEYPSLYFAKEQEVVEYEGTKIMVDDDRMPEALRKTAKKEMVRFRTLGVLSAYRRYQLHCHDIA